MKISTTSILLIFTSILMGQGYKTESQKIWFSTQNINYKEGDFEKIRRFAEFILDHNLNFIEIEEAKKEAKKTFMNNPIGTLNEIAEIDQQMQQVYRLTDVQTVGLVRSGLLLHVYDALLKEPQMPLLGKLINKHCKILAYDMYNNLAFTQKDADGLINLVEFISKINGNQNKISAYERRQTTSQLAQNFNNLNLQEKQLLATMGITNGYIQTVYNKASFTQKNQIKNELNNSLALNKNNNQNQQGSGVDYTKFNNMSASSYQILSNMMLSSHVTNMNILSNIGGSGDYWYIKNY